MRFGETISMGIFGLIGRRAGEQFHVASIEKRGIEFAETPKDRGGAQEASEEYQKHATLEGRISDIRLLIDTLVQEDNIDPTKILLVGHSEGADVAAAVAGIDSRVTHVAFLSGGGAFQFFDFFISHRRTLTQENKSSEEIEEAMEQLEQKIREIMSEPNNTKKFWLGHSYRRWASFAAHSPAESLVKSKAKLFVAHGTADRSVPIESFDYLIARLAARNRKQVSIHRFPNRDHSFIVQGTEPGYEGFMEVVDMIINWAK